MSKITPMEMLKFSLTLIGKKYVFLTLIKYGIASLLRPKWHSHFGNLKNHLEIGLIVLYILEIVD